jgi:hypothetical protein
VASSNHVDRPADPAERPASAEGAPAHGAARPARNARSLGRAGAIVVGLFVALAAIGWAMVMANWSGSPGVTAQVIAFRVTGDDAVVMTYEVAKPSSTTVRCLLVALDERHGEVARTETTIPAGTGHVERTVRLATTARATAATVRACRTR